jgi:choline-sulfatase
MLRRGPWKYCHYVDHPSQLFHLENDPEELNDLAADPGHAQVLRDCLSELRRWLDPDEVDLRAKRRQRELLDGFGGRVAALGRGDLGFTPAPGTGASFD